MSRANTLRHKRVLIGHRSGDSYKSLTIAVRQRYYNDINFAPTEFQYDAVQSTQASHSDARRRASYVALSHPLVSHSHESAARRSGHSTPRAGIGRLAATVGILPSDFSAHRVRGELR